MYRDNNMTEHLSCGSVATSEALAARRVDAYFKR